MLLPQIRKCTTPMHYDNISCACTMNMTIFMPLIRNKNHSQKDRTPLWRVNL